MNVDLHGKTYSTLDKPYKNFMEVFVRRKIQNPGYHASLYFDVFWLNSLTISKDTLISRKLIDSQKPRAFTMWRDEQKALGFLDWEENGQRFGVKYKPGRLTLKYINAMALSSGVLITREDLDATETKFEKKTDDLQRQIDLMHSMLRAVAEDYFARNPPHSSEREEKFNENLKAGKAYLDEDRAPMN